MDSAGRTVLAFVSSCDMDLNNSQTLKSSESYKTSNPAMPRVTYKNSKGVRHTAQRESLKKTQRNKQENTNIFNQTTMLFIEVRTGCYIRKKSDLLQFVCSHECFASWRNTGELYLKLPNVTKFLFKSGKHTHTHLCHYFKKLAKSSIENTVKPNYRVQWDWLPLCFKVQHNCCLPLWLVDWHTDGKQTSVS